MSTIEVLIAARQIAERADVDWRDLEGTPLQQVAQIRSRIAQKTLRLQEELLGITKKRQQAQMRERIAA
jgi:hypothetical protein